MDLLSGLVIHVLRAGLDLADHLAFRGSAQSVPLAGRHAAGNNGLGGVRVLVFHGYLLRGTGSNVYNASSRARSLAWGTRSTCSPRTWTGARSTG